MHQDPFPDPDEDDGEEPDGFPPPDAETGPEQGLFLSLPAGEFDPDQFAQSGPSPDVPPGAMTATLMDMVKRPGRLRRSRAVRRPAGRGHRRRQTAPVLVGLGRDDRHPRVRAAGQGPRPQG